MRVIASYDTTCFVASTSEVWGLDFVTKTLKTYKFEKNESSAIITITVASDGKYIFAGFSSKIVCCWDRITGELLGTGLFKKKPTAIVYSAVNTDQAAILVSDKTGDVWGADAPLLKKQIILAGHTASVVTDMEIFDGLIVTADRDEKLRVSRFPDLETIMSYCLGHTSVVSSTTFLSVGGNTLLVSSSWDHRLNLWNPNNGTLLATKLYPNSTASAEQVVVADDGVDSSEAVEDAMEEEDEEEELEKTYDERTAGNFPFKVTSCNSTNTIAVIFRNLATLKLYGASVQSSSSSVPVKADFVGETVLELLAVPSDIVFVGNRLVALLPQPHYLQVLDITFNSSKSIFEVVDVTSTAEEVKSGVEVFTKHCVETGASFSQVSADQLDEEKNMKKHALDKPFDKTKNIDYTKTRGAKRSKKV